MPLAPCETPSVDIDFTATVPCAPWASAFGTASMIQGGGTLTINPRNVPGVNGGCTATDDAPFTETGFAVEVTGTLKGTNAYTLLYAGAPGPGMPDDPAIGVVNDQL